MASDDGQVAKYSYKSTFQVKRPSVTMHDEPMKAEVKAYINEILGIKKRERRDLTA